MAENTALVWVVIPIRVYDKQSRFKTRFNTRFKIAVCLLKRFALENHGSPHSNLQHQKPRACKDRLQARLFVRRFFRETLILLQYQNQNGRWHLLRIETQKSRTRSAPKMLRTPLATHFKMTCSSGEPHFMVSTPQVPST